MCAASCGWSESRKTYARKDVAKVAPLYGKKCSLTSAAWKRLMAFMLLQALAALALCTEGAPVQVAWYVPRQATLGLMFAGEEVSAHVRLSWEPQLISTPVDEFVGIFELGGGNGIPGLPAGMVNMYQWGAELGLGYRSTLASGFHWGFHAGSGVLFYGAHFGTGRAEENRVTGTVEGSVQLGYTVSDIRWGVQLRYAEPYDRYPRSISAQYLGGLYFGVFANWR